MQLHKDEGIVIRTVPYGESNVILTLLTKENGKIAVMARGAKRPKSRVSAASQLIIRGLYLHFRGRGMSTLSQADVLESYRYIRSDITRMAYATYMVELVDKVTEENASYSYVFASLSNLLNRMNEKDDPEVLKQILEVKMMTVAGIRPELKQCVQCRKLEEMKAFSIRHAGLLCKNCYMSDTHALLISEVTAKVLRLFDELEIKRIGTLSLKNETKAQIKTVLRTYYDEYAGIHLKSQRFLDQLERWPL